jgi:hypothetical protein
MIEAPAELPRFLRPLFLVVDLGFIAYWAITLAGVIPDEYLFKNYDNPILSAWNWSCRETLLQVSEVLMVSGSSRRYRLLTSSGARWCDR